MAKLTKKLILSYLFITSIMLGLGLYSIYTVYSINQNGEEIYQARLIPISQLSKMSKSAENTRVIMLQTVIAKDPSIIEKAEQNIEDIQGLIQSYEISQMDPREKAKLSEFQAFWDQYTAIVKKNIELVRSGNYEEANEGLKKAREPFTKASDTLLELMEINEQLAKQVMQQSESKFQTSSMILGGVILVSILLAVAIGWITGRIISTPILQLAKGAQQIAQGDLIVTPISVKNKDELADLVCSFNQMVGQLRYLVSTVRKTSDELAAGSQEMAASAEQVTSSVEEISANTQCMAKDAEYGNQAVIDASKVLLELSALIQIAKSKATIALESSKVTGEAASDGKQIVNDTIQRMKSIQSRTVQTEEQIATLNYYTKEIEMITNMITNIAAQTNLLALNASIEAARAGEHGRGFAVVANEVRQLAEQSNEGASQVSELIRKISTSMNEVVSSTQENRREVEKGTEVVYQAGLALDKIIVAVHDSQKEVDGIKEVTTEEVATSDKIVTLIHSLSNIIENTASGAQDVSTAIQQTSAGMQTVSATAQETSAIAQDLVTAVDSFKL